MYHFPHGHADTRRTHLFCRRFTVVNGYDFACCAGPEPYCEAVPLANNFRTSAAIRLGA
jgi:hypothetical protein